MATRCSIRSAPDPLRSLCVARRTALADSPPGRSTPRLVYDRREERAGSFHCAHRRRRRRGRRTAAVLSRMLRKSHACFNCRQNASIKEFEQTMSICASTRLRELESSRSRRDRSQNCGFGCPIGNAIAVEIAATKLQQPRQQSDSSTSTEATTGRTSPRAHVRRVDAGIATFRNRSALPVAAMASRSLWS